MPSVASASSSMLSLSMNPLKQGLKLLWHCATSLTHKVFIHESIKTRVETVKQVILGLRIDLSLSMNPLKQGLKQCLTYG